MSNDLKSLVDGIPLSGAAIVVGDIHSRELVKQTIMATRGAKVLRFSKILIVTTKDSVRASVGGLKLPVLVDPKWWNLVDAEVIDYLVQVTGIMRPPPPEKAPVPVAATEAPKPTAPAVRPTGPKPDDDDENGKGPQRRFFGNRQQGG